ncbi:MAG: ATP-grasp domain-containing protein [Saprospirales bacterium]|nr:ATP-grasp domain-containing protein [Saprospirales bacterium]MBK8923133.1 ATP-grasp domain-containing protein [Saprospirales bacterium]
MTFIIYACPNFTANAVRFIDVLSALPAVHFGLIAQEPAMLLPPEIQSRLAAFRQVEDVFNADGLTQAVADLQAEQGPVHRLIGAVEPLQAPLAFARERLGVEGMGVEATLNFRDKQRMKVLFRQAGLPCARSQEVRSRAEATAFVETVGFPVVVKPPDGAGSLSTFKVHSAAELEMALANMPGAAALLEEFVTGTEHSFDTFSLNGQPVFHSISHYYPNPLEVMREPWIQWQVLVPREVEAPEYDDIRQAAFQALQTLGMDTGVSHLEWFRRPDGSLAISEVAARPPGAQILTLIGRAAGFDAIGAWARLVVFGEFEAPRRQYAVGAAYLRGQGRGCVRAVHGLEIVQHEFGSMVTDFKIPQIGQEAAANYEGEGYIILRHPETEVLRQALSRVVSVVRVELR